MKYFFILGANPALSLAEIYAKLGPQAEYKLIGADCLVLKTFASLSADKLMRDLGGVIKIGQVVDETDKGGVMKAIDSLYSSYKKERFFFGFSVYGQGKINLKDLAMKLKRQWQDEGSQCRWVTNRESNLTSVTLEQSGLLRRGAEAVLLGADNRWLVGKTLAVQPFKDWSRRDFGRPERDDYSGMLPPKLARIMINLAKYEATETLLDPFCGSGTVLSEAAYLGGLKLLGNDISLQALEDTKKNLAWLKEHFVLKDFRCQLYAGDARALPEILPVASVDKIVTEPYLGPARGRRQRQSVARELTALYEEFLNAAYKILKPNGRLVMVWPILMSGDKPMFLPMRLNNWRIVSPWPTSLPWRFKALSQRQTIVYGRPGQKVWREIVILEKK